eukprot:365126-Chlamydomonas_euryale.AAC.28
MRHASCRRTHLDGDRLAGLAVSSSQHDAEHALAKQGRVVYGVAVIELQHSEHMKGMCGDGRAHKMCGYIWRGLGKSCGMERGGSMVVGSTRFMELVICHCVVWSALACLARPSDTLKN